MNSSQDTPVGPIRRLLTDEHRRLDDLLDRAGGCATPDELAAYDEFRRGVLRHIGIEEKILFAMAQKQRGGEPLPQAARLRLDHGALAALLMPPPSGAILRAIKVVLAAHNPLEEIAGGVYETCEAVAGDEAAHLLEVIIAAPAVPTNPNSAAPKAFAAARRALIRAGYDDGVLDH